MPTFYGLTADHNVEQLKVERHATDFLFTALRQACLLTIIVPIKGDAKSLSLTSYAGLRDVMFVLERSHNFVSFY